jgi:hypothetical protein
MKIYLLALVSIILISFTSGAQSQTRSVGNFEAATCPFELPENLVEGEKLKIALMPKCLIKIS